MIASSLQAAKDLVQLCERADGNYHASQGHIQVLIGKGDIQIY